MEKEYIFRVGDVEAKVIRKRIKNMYLRVLPPDGRVQVTVPARASLEEVGGFLKKNWEWLQAKRQVIADRPAPRERQYVTGEPVRLWGEEYSLAVRFVEAHGAVCRKGERLLLYAPEGSTAEERRDLLHRWYRVQLQRAIQGLRDRCEAVVGQKAKEYRIRDMKTRWGTCNTQARRIWLNLQLAKYPLHCLEYIMFHELTHLWERRHNARFHGLMDRFCPEWRKVRKELNDHAEFF